MISYVCEHFLMSRFAAAAATAAPTSWPEGDPLAKWYQQHYGGALVPGVGGGGAHAPRVKGLHPQGVVNPSQKLDYNTNLTALPWWHDPRVRERWLVSSPETRNLASRVSTLASA